MQAEVFFTTMLTGAAAAALGLLLWRRSGRRSRSERQAERLLADGRAAEGATLMATAGRHRAAADQLVMRGMPEMAVQVLADAGDFVAAARVAASAHDYARAGELFRLGGDRRTAAAMLERAGNHAAALALYIELRDADRVAGLCSREGLDSGLLEKAAVCLQEAGDQLSAARAFIRAGKAERGSSLLCRMGKPEEAAAALEEAGDLKGAAELHSKMGQHRRAAYLLVKAGHWEAAAAQLEADRDYLSAARLLRKIGRPVVALESLKKLTPDNPGYRGGMMLASAILEECGRLGEAVAVLYGCLEHIGYKMETCEAITRLVELQWLYGDLAGAQVTIERAMAEGVHSEALDELLDELQKASREQIYEPVALPGAGKSPDTRKATGSSIGFPRDSRFQLIRRLGRGGNALIFHVIDRRNGQEVALKLLFSDILPLGEARRYFEREARVASELRHPNIVRVLDAGELEGRPYLTMEFVDGVNLLQAMDVQDPPSLKQRIGICVQLCEALSYAHSRGVIHRDVKLENVLVARNGQVKLTDFGLAKVLGEASVRSGFIVGTPLYMSPEQIAGKELDGRTDIYSLGVLMYRLFTGRYPYDPAQMAVITWPPAPVPPLTLAPFLPEALSGIILKCLMKDPSERFSSAAEIRSALLPLGA